MYIYLTIIIRIPGQFDDENVHTALITLDVGVVVGYLQHVPNQPLFFPVSRHVTVIVKLNRIIS